MILNFYYHPILGLQYTCLDDLFEIDIAMIPQEFDVEKIITIMKQTGVQFVNSEREVPYTPIQQILQITNYIL